MDGKTKIQMALKVRDANQDDKIKIDRNIKSVSHNINWLLVYARFESNFLS